MKINILYEDEYIIVVHKPAGIASQEDRSFNVDMVSTLKNMAVRSARKAGKKGTISEPYIGVVHRLDKPVEGVMVYAKTKRAAAELSKQASSTSSDKSFKKKYRCTVAGILPVSDEYITLNDYLFFDKSNNTSIVVPKNTADSKKSVLQYRVISNSTLDDYGDVSSLDINLITGRHHQIRVQLTNIGHPIIGDSRYGSFTPREKLSLCAYSLTFTHPISGKLMEFHLD